MGCVRQREKQRFAEHPPGPGPAHGAVWVSPIASSLEKFSLPSRIPLALLPPLLCGAEVRKGRGVQAEHSLRVG